MSARSRHRVPCNRRSRRCRVGQATIEFSYVAPLFFLTLFATVQAALWSVQTSAAVSAADQGVRLAASSLAQTDRAVPSSLIAQKITPNLERGLFGTRVRAWPAQTPGQPGPACPLSPAEVEQKFGPRTVAVCAEPDNDPSHLIESGPATASSGACSAVPPPIAGCGKRSNVVILHLVGYIAAMVPPVGFNGSGGELPLNLGVVSHTLTFGA